MSPITVLLAEDHTIVRKGLLSLLQSEANIEVVGEAADGHTAVRLACELQPDIVVMDITMPLLNGLEATRHIKRALPETHVVALTVHATEEYIYQILKAGASAYILKQAAPRELVMAIRCAHAGDTFLSPSVSRLVIQEYIDGTRGKDADDEYQTLTDREREVLQLLVEGYSTREIAELLVVSIKTIESHRNNLMNKLDIHNLPDLTRYAIRKGIVPLE